MIAWRPIGVVAAALMLHMKLSTCRSPGQGEAGATSAQESGATDVNLAEVDTAGLTAREKREWSTYVAQLLAPCQNQPVNVAQCVKEKRDCVACVPAARYLATQVRLGKTRTQVEASYRTRFAADKVIQIEIGDSPTKGPADAPITLIEFADFECPACQAAKPVIDKVLEGYIGKVRFVYKNYPLSIHPNAELAARAAVAALKQGKFWEMHAKMFEGGGPLERSRLDHIAREIGLDVKKFSADLDTEAVADRVAQDRKQGDSVDIQGTPTLFINGRRFESGGEFEQDFKDWLDLELELKGVRHQEKSKAEPAVSAPPPAMSAAGSAPSASAQSPDKSKAPPAASKQ
jgi:protein-disulfide isomerase